MIKLPKPDSYKALCGRMWGTLTTARRVLSHKDSEHYRQFVLDLIEERMAEYDEMFEDVREEEVYLLAKKIYETEIRNEQMPPWNEAPSDFARACLNDAAFRLGWKYDNDNLKQGGANG